MAANISAQAGEAQITLLDLVSNYDSKKVSIGNGVIEFNYYESILDTTVRVSASFMDTGNRGKEGQQGSVSEQKDVNLNFGEFLELKMTDGNGTQLIFTGDKKFRIMNASDRQGSVNKESFTMHMTSLEYANDAKFDYFVKKVYEGKIDETVRKILTEALKTKKTLDIDPTYNSYCYRLKPQSPFHACGYLASRSIPNVPNANQNLAGYFFFETADGYKFKSIDGLLAAKPKRTIIYNQIIESSPPEGYNGKILDYAFDKTLDLKLLMQIGAIGRTQLRTFDTKPGNAYRETDFTHAEQFEAANAAGNYQINWGADMQDYTRVFSATTDYGHSPPGSTQNQISKSKDELNYDINAIMRQAIMRYNTLFLVKLNVVIAGDLNLRAGDIIHCDFPEVSGDASKTYSSTKSGIYMISDLCHRITKNGCFTSLNLVRDSIGRKPIQRT